MVVEITNITDGPGKTPTQVDIYNKTLDPGASVKLPAELVDRKVRALEQAGIVAIGQVPPWYASAKSRKGRSLSPEEMASRQQVKAPVPEVQIAAEVVEKVTAYDEVISSEVVNDRKRKR